MAQLKDLIVNGPSRFIGDVYATTFTGNLEGNANTATNATNAGMIAGLSVHSGRNNEANKIVRTDGNGYLQVGYINSSSGHEKNASSPTYVWGSNSSDSYLRSYQTSSLSVKYATSSGSCSGNAATATKASYLDTGGMALYANNNNEINFGGTNTSSIIFFGYRATGSKPIPTSFIFGGSGGTALLTAGGFKKKDSSASYVLTGDGGHAAISGLSVNYATTSGSCSGNAATATNASSAGNADKLDGVHYQNILERQYSGSASSGTATGWFRIAETLVNDGGGITFLLAIQRTYHYTNNESYLFSISISFGGGISITQLSGYANTRLITKIRVDWANSQKAYVDLYINTSSTNNNYYWYTIGCAKSYTSWTANPTLVGHAYEFTTVQGCRSDRGFTGNLTGTAAMATNADMLDGYHAQADNNKPWGTIPVITGGGWMDVGKHFEFHYDNTTGSDYSTMLRCTGNYSNIIDLPSKSGTLALVTDNVASATNADKLDGYHASSFSLTSHTHSYIVTQGDNRSVATKPSDYINRITFAGLKTNTTIGRPASTTYSYVVGLRGWSDSSGGKSHELAFNDNGIFHRIGATDAWEAWAMMLTTDKFINYALPLSGGTLTGNIATKSFKSGTDSLGLYIEAKSNVGIRLQYNKSTTGSNYDTLLLKNGVISWNNNTLIHAGNYNSYAPKLNGTGASGTWGISISGNAATATKLATSRTIWGHNFDGTGNVKGALSGVTTINSTLYIDSSGNIGIGTASSSYKLYVDGDGYFTDNVITESDFSSRGNAIIDGFVGIGTQNPAYKLDVNGTIQCTKLLQTSDIKYKTNIKQIEYEEALKIIENLNPVTWDWNENTVETGSSSGFIAQEAEEFIPNAISRDNKNNLSLDYTQLHSYEIKVIQEQQKEIIKLKEKLKILEKLIS